MRQFAYQYSHFIAIKKEKGLYSEHIIVWMQDWNRSSKTWKEDVLNICKRDDDDTKYGWINMIDSTWQYSLTHITFWVFNINKNERKTLKKTQNSSILFIWN